MNRELYKVRPRDMSVKEYVLEKFKKANKRLIEENGGLGFGKATMCIMKDSGFIVFADDDKKIECDSDYGQWRAALEVKGVTRIVKDPRPMNQKALLCANKVLSPEEQK